MKCFKNSQMLVVVALSLLLCSFVSMASAAETAIYVSPKGNDSWTGDSIDKPFATIQKTRDTIRAIKKRSGLTKPVTVYLRGGTYELSETLVFTLEDSGTNACSITYRAYQNEKPIISGGRKIDGSWKKYKGKIMVCTIPEVKKGEWSFKQLFLDGERQTRARFPNENDTFYRPDETEEDLGRDAMKYRVGHFKKWKNLNDVVVVIFHIWNESLLPVSNINEKERIVTFTGPIGRRLGSGSYLNRYYIDNVLEGLDQPGEWYLDRHDGKLYYWPPSDLEHAELRAPILNELVRFEGDVKKKNHIQYINIRGLTFCDVDYILPGEGIPTIRDPGDIWFPAAITMKGVSDCVFEDNTVRNVGTYGVDLTGDGNHIIGNKIYDTGSGGIITRSYGKHRNIISYNHVYHCGSVFHSAVGINIDDGGGLIANNLVHDTSHSGIYGRHFATAYGQERERRNQEQGLIIEYNEIYDVMHGMNDGGGIFVRDDYITIRNNLIHDVWTHPEGQGSTAYGIHLGCDTRNCLVENNVVYRAQGGQIVWQNHKNNTIFNNIFIEGEMHQLNYANPAELKHEKIRLLRNIISFSDPGAVLYKVNERSLPMESDYNLIFHTKGKDMVITGLPGVDTFEDWQKRGFDTHSIIADPLFVDPENDNYSLRPDSPAFELGFKPIDLSRVGLRGRR
ncbi:right-handed parallel beta-helix repeat-containing protein [Planctomycetota bacterium]